MDRSRLDRDCWMCTGCVNCDRLNSPLLGAVDHIPDQDADAVTRLHHQGAAIMGKTNTPAYCQDLHTDNALFASTLNPHDPARTVGGSFAGPAAAVAAHLTAADHGATVPLRSACRPTTAGCTDWGRLTDSFRPAVEGPLRTVPGRLS
ncbi:amidase family protein [Streptomyces canus]|uniref:amidase family protein n=1 Tax=Streptomyces canus TaxID=58343 RepID=UPI0033A0E551